MKILKDLYEYSRTTSLAIVLVVLSVVWGGLYKFLNLTITESLFILSYVLVCFFASMFLIIYIVSETKNEKLNNFIGFFETDIASLRSWFFSHNRLNEAEGNLKLSEASEIWVVSNKLEYEKKGGIFRKSIEENLKKKINYKYVIPDDTEIEGIANSLKNGFDIPNAPSYIQITKISKDSFDYPSDIVVYNPLSTSDSVNPARMFMELKINDDPQKRGWIEVSSGELHKILNHIKRDMGKKSVEQHLEDIHNEIKQIKTV